MASLVQSDAMTQCIKRIVYDDASTKQQVKDILDKYKDQFEVIKNTKNLGQKSMVAFLKYIIENIDSSTYDYIFYLDNDALIHKDSMKICAATYRKIQREQELDTDKIILTGFHTLPSLPIVKSYDGYAEKIA